MKVTSKGQVTIPQNVREEMGIQPAETEVEFIRDENGRWFLSKTKPNKEQQSRFRSVHTLAKPLMSTEALMALTRGD
jgi:AbrB family looped-hinge helix DNA binding protein